MATPRRTTAPRYTPPWATPTRTPAPLYTRAEASLEIGINEVPRSAAAAGEIMIRRDMVYPFVVKATARLPRTDSDCYPSKLAVLGRLISVQQGGQDHRHADQQRDQGDHFDGVGRQHGPGPGADGRPMGKPRPTWRRAGVAPFVVANPRGIIGTALGSVPVVATLAIRPRYLLRKRRVVSWVT